MSKILLEQLTVRLRETRTKISELREKEKIHSRAASDTRAEIIGLMKAEETINEIIVSVRQAEKEGL